MISGRLVRVAYPVSVYAFDKCTCTTWERICTFEMIFFSNLIQFVIQISIQKRGCHLGIPVKYIQYISLSDTRKICCVNYFIDIMWHCILQWIFIYRKDYREVGLFWGGSIINSLIVLMVGGAVGKIKFSQLISFPQTLLEEGNCVCELMHLIKKYICTCLQYTHFVYTLFHFVFSRLNML